MKHFSTAALCVCALLTASMLRAQHSGPEVRLPDEDRLYSPAAALRAPLAKSGATAFFATRGDWTATWNPVTGTPHRAWGRGLSIEGFSHIDGTNLADAASRFVSAYADVLRADPGALELLSARVYDGTGYVIYRQRHRGIPVLNARVDVRISSDARVMMFGSDFHPGLDVDVAPGLDRGAAGRFARAGLDGDPARMDVRGGELFILPLIYPDKAEYRLVYRFEVAVSDEEAWDTYVDATDGRILWRTSLVHSFGHEGGEKTPTATVTGRVTASVYSQNLLTPPALQPMPRMYVNIGGKEVVTGDDGTFSATITGDSAVLVARLAGPHSLARRSDSSTATPNARFVTTIRPGVPVELVWDNTNSTMAERMAAFHIRAIRDYIRALDTSSLFADVDKQMVGVVNINQECNANWNGRTINFFRESDRCVNTGEIADVIYHEYGHAINSFTYPKLNGQGIRSGAVSEGSADITANMILDDERIGIGFYKNAGVGTLRNSDNTLVYPRDLSGEIHLDGRILTGAVWDVRKAIGIDAARRLTHKVRYGAPDGKTIGEAFFDYFLETLIADDNDGDLSNGSPNATAIISAFVAHGIVGNNIVLTHTPIADQSDAFTSIGVYGTADTKETVARNLFVIGAARLVYSTDLWLTADTVDLNYDAASKSFTGAFPPLGRAAVVRYFIEANDNFGSVARLPFNAPATDYVFLLGYRTQSLATFESADGWTQVDECATGRWVRATPNGTYNKQQGTPPNAPYIQTNLDHTPGTSETVCWVTGNAATTLGHDFDDVDSGRTTLHTPVMDMSGYRDPIIRYYRWFTNTVSVSSPGSDPWLVRISPDGVTWKNIEYTTRPEPSWTMKIFRVRDYFEPGPGIRLAFLATDNKPESIVEAALDDFEVLDLDGALDAGHAAPLPSALRLAVHPNPASAGAAVRLELDRATTLRLSVYDALGKEVLLLRDGMADAGTFSAAIPSGVLRPGAYILRAQTASGRAHTRLLVTR